MVVGCNHGYLFGVPQRLRFREPWHSGGKVAAVSVSPRPLQATGSSRYLTRPCAAVERTMSGLHRTSPEVMPMYQVKPICGGDIKIDMPTCMYKLPNVHAPRSGCGEHAHQALEVRQDEILRRLYELKAAVDGLAKTVTTPDADLDATTIPQQGGASATLTGTADLDSLLGKDLGALRDVVINAHPARPPLSLLVLHSLLCQRYQVLSSVHVHSSIPSSAVPPQLLNSLGPRPPHSYIRQRFQLGFTLIWKDAAATLSDSWVDTGLFQLAEGGAKERAAVMRALNAALGRSSWLVGAELSLADIVCACCVLQSGSAPSAPPNVQRWLKSCENLGHFARATALLH
ncbi:hypothetical protein JZ751_006327 [Albula glossodonta]|uniref:Aminoacyl tRNA synthase complex-interacting multifunctional protein 2 n=1 Tax=Albula glossodonta TaxID=121402 RepID=A0A8T2N695_9TELE|nr:hypothetical protein JZ751_006327 [Albula glossodonta]